MNSENKEIGYFFVACGGPFYELQRRLGLLREDAFHAKPRAVMLVALTWGVPLVLSLITGDAYGPFADKPFLLTAGAWAKYFIAVGLFILMEKAGRGATQQTSRTVHQGAAPCAGVFRSCC